MSLQDRLTVQWCMNSACRLYGMECYEKVCTACEKTPTVLTWTVVVCEPRGVYGALVAWPESELPPAIRAYTCRSCVYYKSGGSAGLATQGPQQGSRITGALDEALLDKPKNLFAMSAAALSAWEDEPWP